MQLKSDDDNTSRHDGSRLIRESASIICNEYYHSFVPGIERMIRLSKKPEYRTDQTHHLAIQWGVLEQLEKMDKAVSDGNALARQENDEQIALRARQNRYLARAYREIGEGVAWRTLDYSRFTMRILSQGRSPGHAYQKEGRKAELSTALAGVSNGNLVILNDSTISVRIGDLIAVNPTKKDISIAEVKAKRLITVSSIMRKLNSKPPQALNKQEQRLIQAQYAIDSKTFPHGKEDIPITFIEPPIHNYLAEAQAIMKEAGRRGGVFGRLVAPYMYIEAIDLPELFRNDYETLLDQARAPKLEMVARFSSFDRLVINFDNEVVRASPPYAVYPFTPKVIAKLITGELMVTAYIYREPLVRRFRELGWRLNINESAFDEYRTITDKDNVDYFSSPLLFPDQLNDMADLMMLSYPNGYNMSVFQLVCSMAIEFGSVEGIVLYAEAMMATRKPGDRGGAYPESLTERQVWS